MSDDETWLFNDNQSLLRVANYRLTDHWRIKERCSPLVSTSAIAVSNGHLLTWSNVPFRGRMFWVELNTWTMEEIAPVDDAGDPITDFDAVGRGSKLWLQTKQALYVIDAAALVS